MTDLSGKWVSSFIQNNKIYNEEVIFVQENNRIFANIKLNYDGEMLEYKFNGVFNKNILNGTYECLDDCEIESGTISLKVVNENFLDYLKFYIFHLSAL